jgi:hypothetical protein
VIIMVDREICAKTVAGDDPLRGRSCGSTVFASPVWAPTSPASAAVPSEENMRRLCELATDVESNGVKLDCISGANSSAQPYSRRATGAVNQARIGEAILLAARPPSAPLGRDVPDAFGLMRKFEPRRSRQRRWRTEQTPSVISPP